MSYLLGLLLVAGIAVFIGLPLLRPEGAAGGEMLRENVARDHREEDEALERRKEEILSALNELEYDFQMRKVSPEDYRALKAGLTRQAIALFREEEEAGGGAELKEIEQAIEAEIEREIERQLSALEGNGPR